MDIQKTGEILYENLDYGTYIMSYDMNFDLQENVRFHVAEFDKLYVRRIRLPDGKGNVVYLFSDTFQNTLKLINSNNFIIPPTYRRFFYPQLKLGAFMGRRYKLNLVRERNDRVKLIKDSIKQMPVPTRTLQPGQENILFGVSDIYETVKPIMMRFNIKKIFTKFFNEFNTIISDMTPEPTKESANPAFNNRIMIIDAGSFGFKMGAPLEENKTNPLFLIYLAFLRTRSLSSLNIDRDILITSGNMFMKFNPAKITGDKWSKFRLALFKIMKANLDDYTDQLTPEEQAEVIQTSEDHLIHNIVDDSIKPYTKFVSPATKGVLGDAIDAKIQKKAFQNNTRGNLIRDVQQQFARGTGTRVPIPSDDTTDKKLNYFQSILNDYKPLTSPTAEYDDPDDDDDDPDIIDDFQDDIEDDINEVINDDDILDEIDNEIQEKIAPMSNPNIAPVNSARDLKLREQQRQVVVKDSTIEEILQRDVNNIPIQSDNKSHALHTSNKNMHNITFANFDKTYIEELYTKDLVSCFNSLQDKGSPFYIKSINIEDTSTSMDLKETWTVKMEDENKKSHTIKVDIPKFYNNRFMMLGGNKYIILKQNFYNPLVKDTPDTVIMTTNYQKVTIQRRATKSLASVEKIFSLIRKTGDDKIFQGGDSTQVNLRYISSLEYDELSRRLFKFQTDSCTLYFSRQFIADNLQEELDNVPKMKGDEFWIGTESGNQIIINENTGLDRQGRTIIEIMEANMSEEMKAVFNSIRPPSQSMFVEAKLAGQWLPVSVILVAWIGLTRTLDKMGMQWQFHAGMKRVPQNQTPSLKYLKFADGVLEYHGDTYAELIMNGLNKLNPEKNEFASFDTIDCYLNYIHTVWGNSKGLIQLRNFFEFLIDPITKEVCRDLKLPDDPDGLMIHAVKILTDNKFNSKASDKSYRVRSVEMIPSILYYEIAQQYMAYVKTGRRLPMTLKQNAVIQKLQAEKTVEAYSTLNPAIEMGKAHTISTKGYKGSNSEYSYDEEKRSYDPSSVGKIAMSTSADANVGINRELVIEPTLTNARGYRDPVEDPETLSDVNIFSPVEMLTPGTARNEDPIRTAIANKQSQHLVPVANASMTLVSNGFDEALQFHLSNDFVINAEEDGKVIEINEEVGFIMVQYKSGKHFAINLKADVVANLGGGFYTANQLKPLLVKVGQTFKKDEVLAYHDKYFKYSKINGLRYAIGPLVKMAFMSTYNTYEDAGICTESLAEKMKTNIVYPVVGMFTRNNNIVYMAKIGDHVNIGDILIRYDKSFEDTEIAKMMSKLSEENKAVLADETKNDIKSDHAGRIIDIKVYTLHEPSNLSPSLGKVVQQYFDRGKSKKKFLEKYDSSQGTIKAGYLFTDSTAPIENRYGVIKNKYKGFDVVVEFYIEHSDVMGVGDKIALYSANKQIISEVIPAGYEPYSEFRPEEEIGVITSPGTIARRMTPAVIPISSAMKVLIELKRHIKDKIRYK